MAYFITGGTGFIGRNFIDKLAVREGDIYVLTRAGSMQKFEELRARLGDQGTRLIPVTGDLREPLLGLDSDSGLPTSRAKFNISAICRNLRYRRLRRSADRH